MTDEPQKKPDPIEDVRKGLGLLLRAATTAVNSLPTGKLETAVVSGVKEVGRAFESVAQAIDKEVFKNGKPVYSTSKPSQPYAGDVKKDAPQSAEGPTYTGGDKDDGKVWATQQPPSPMDPPAPDAPAKSPDDPQNPAPPPPPGEPTTDPAKS